MSYLYSNAVSIYNSNNAAITPVTRLPVDTIPYGMSADAFGRARVSTPLTMFDSSHRYRDNGLWATSNTATATYSFLPNEGSVSLNLDTTSNAEIVRETTKVFAYLPGKSLLNLDTFVMAPAKANLRQRVGYFGANNGYFVELDGTSLYLTERSSVTGITTDTRVPQSSWNIDKLDGTGLSGITIDMTKAQIWFIDIEWLGVGSVRCGFIIDGVFTHCHTFHHANVLATTYVTTASLPIRYEIKNTGVTASSSTLRQICSTIISEGGYELRGLQQAIETPIATPKAMATASTLYPVVSLRLKSDRLDAIVIISAAAMLSVATGNYNWKIVANGVTGGGTWVSAGTDSAVEYNLEGTSIDLTNARTTASGFMSSTNQSTAVINIPKDSLFKFQFERNSLTSTPYEISLCAAADGASRSVYGSLDWEEVSR